MKNKLKCLIIDLQNEMKEMDQEERRWAKQGEYIRAAELANRRDALDYVVDLMENIVESK